MSNPTTWAPRSFQDVMPYFTTQLKTDSENHDLWFRFGLTISLSNQSPLSALRALNECMRLNENDPSPALLAAKISLEDLDDPAASLDFAQMAIERSRSVNLQSRSYILASIAHAYIYEREPMSMRDEKELKTSLDLLEQAVRANPNDHLVHFHMALFKAKQRSYPKAIDNLRRAIEINPHHMPSMQLLILSLSALKLYDKALVLCESLLHEYEDNLLLLYIKCSLEQNLVETKGYKVALSTAQHMLKSIRQSAERVHDNRNYSSTTTISATAQSLADLSIAPTTPLAQNIDSNLHTETVSAPNHANPALPRSVSNTAGDSKQISNLFCNDINISERRDNLFRNDELSIWILVAEIFVKIGSVEDAEMCVDEGSVYASGALSHQIMFIRGLIAKARNHLMEAKTYFQSCLALCPRHAKALQQIAHVYYLDGNYPTAEKFLQDSLDLDEDCHKTWYYLSLVYIEMNQHDKANNCVKRSTALEESAPVVPFSAISRLTLR